MNIEETKIKSYIKNYFHQYFDLTLCKDITSTNFVNLVIPIEDLSKVDTSERHHYSHDKVITDETNIDDILSKYPDTDIVPNLKGYCFRVVDGDTIVLGIPYERKEGNKTITDFKEERIRLVGVDTPEEGYDGYQSSTTFLEKICYTENFFNLSRKAGIVWDKTENCIKKNNKSIKNNKKVEIKIDSKKERDKYGRILGVLVVKNKNINEVILKERLGQVMYLPPSEFNPFDWSDINSPVNVYQFSDAEVNLLSAYLRPDMKNIVFTPKNDLNTIYKCEVYKNVIYVKLEPYSMNITMHLLPKAYDCTNNLLILKDSMISKRTVSKYKNSDYNIYEEKDYINAYYQTDGHDRDRNTIPVSNRAQLMRTEINSKTFCDFEYDISNDTQAFKNLEICAGYRYNNTSPFYSLHYTGAKDNNKSVIHPVEDRAFLVDVNVDAVINENTKNIISQMVYTGDQTNTVFSDDIVDTPTHKNGGTPPVKGSYGYPIDHISEIGALHHKKLKYIHDTLYSEEDTNRFSEYKHYGIAEWEDPSRPQN